MIKLNIDKTVPYPESTEPDKAATLREDMQLAANTAAVLNGLGADVEDSPFAQDEADEVFAQFSEIAKKQFEDAMSEKPKRGRPRIHPEKPSAPALLEKLPVAQWISTMLREYNNPIVAMRRSRTRFAR